MSRTEYLKALVRMTCMLAAIDDTEHFGLIFNMSVGKIWKYTDWGREVGFESVSYMTQTKFIQTWAPFQSRREEESADSFLVDESGMGGICKVLHQRKPG